MERGDAEEYTQALGQIGSGWWRQIALGQRLGVPEALGLTTDEWVTSRLGGYIRLSIPERREAAKELTAPVDDGGQGMSQREAAAVLGVANSTVSSDLRTVRIRTPDDEDETDSVRNRTPDEGESSEVACEDCGTPTLPHWLNREDEFASSALLCGRCAERREQVAVVLAATPVRDEIVSPLDHTSEGQHVWRTIMELSACRDKDVSEVVAGLPRDRLEHVERVCTVLIEWLREFSTRAAEREAREPVVLNKKRGGRAGKDVRWPELV